MSDIYNPFVSELFTIDKLPDGLSFVAGDLNSVFNQINYQNLVVEHSLNDTKEYYQLYIIVDSLLQLDILGTGLILTLNPDIQSGSSQCWRTRAACAK